MRNVLLLITMRYAVALQIIMVIHSYIVHMKQVS